MPDGADREAQATFEEAERFLDEARRLHRAGFSGPSLRSSYYAMYHAARALLRLEGSDPKTHRGVVSEFTRLLVREGPFTEETSGDLSRVLSERLESDYEPGLEVTQEKANWALNRARRFVDEVGDELATRLS